MDPAYLETYMAASLRLVMPYTAPLSGSVNETRR